MYNYRLKTITPIHIGNGNKLTNLDFIQEGNLIHVISFDKYISLLNEEQLNRLENILQYKQLNDLSKEVRKHLKECLKYRTRLETLTKNNNIQEIVEHIKTTFNKNGEYGIYIPGSTIKGFIRFAILYKMIKENPNIIECKNKNDKNNVSNVENKLFTIEWKDNQSKTSYLKTMSYLKISDSETISIDHLFINYIHVYNTNRTIAEYVEVIKKDTTIRLKIKEDFKNFILDSEINKNNIKKVQDWKEACYEFSKDIIENEINFFKQRNKENIVKLYQELKELNQKDSPLLRIGKYKGKISQTLVLLSQKNECLRTNFPKTRRLVDNSIPLGWIKLEKILQKT